MIGSTIHSVCNRPQVTHIYFFCKTHLKALDIQATQIKQSSVTKTFAWSSFALLSSLWQDKADDRSLGLKSTALLFGDNSKIILSAFSALTAAGLLASGESRLGGLL